MAQATLSETSNALNVNPDAPAGPVLKMVNGRPVVSSLDIADHFGKRHDNLVRSIQAIIRNAPESFSALNFEEAEYIDAQGKPRISFDLTRDGFVIVAMGFTGKKAIAWKITYVMAFNAMEAELCARQSSARPSADLSKLTTVEDRRPLKALVDAWVAAAKANGKFLAHTEAFRIARTPVGGRKMKELTLADIPVAMAYVQEQLERELTAASPMAVAATEPAPALPVPRRITFEEYRRIYPSLPGSPRYWDELRDRIYTAMVVFMDELKAVQKEAVSPFHVNRKSNVQNYLDAAMGPMYSLWNSSEETLRLSYKNAYDALDGCRDTWLLLHKG